MNTNIIKRTVSNGLFKVKKHSPELLLGGGLILGVGAAIKACHSTTKLSQILDETKDELDAIHEVKDDPDSMPEGYTLDDAKKDLSHVYLRTAVDVTKLYLPSIAMGVASVGCILASYGIINKRNAGLSAALTTSMNTFKDYRSRVVDRFGAELDRELRYDIKAEEIDETTVDKKGKEKVVKKTVDVASINEPSDYARFFDSTCPNWDENPEYTLTYLKRQEDYANDKLKIEGRLFLNDVYKLLGFQPTKAGQVVGWIYDEKNPIGDNRVDFGIYNQARQANRRFVNGLEPVILLDFNVDGNIWDLM